MWPFNRKHPQNNHNFTDADRDYSEAIRALKAQQRLLAQKAKTLELKNQIAELQGLTEDDSQEISGGLGQIEQLIFNKLLSPGSTLGLSPLQAPQSEEPGFLSQEQIKLIGDTAIKKMKSADKDQLRQILATASKTDVLNLLRYLKENI